MARLNSSVISNDPDNEPEVGQSGRVDGNSENIALLLKQDISSGQIEVMRTTSDSGAFPGSSGGSVLIGDGANFPSVAPGTPREKVDVEGAVRAFDFVLNDNGRRVGEVLEQLLPNAEVLSTTSSDQGASQNLSLAESANTRSGTINRSSGDLFSNSENQTNDPYETGIFDGQGTQGRIQGTLNFDKTGATGQYPDDAFTQGDTGELRLYVDGTLVDTADLTSTQSSINTTGGSGTNFGTDTGFVVEASDDVTFADGSATGNRYRTAQLQVVESEFGSFGLHTIEVVHFDPSTSSEIGDTNTAVFYYDPSVQNGSQDISITRQGTVGDGYNYGTVVTSGSKTVSGVDYFTLASVETDIDVANLYYYTYDENGLTFDQLSNFDISAPTVPSPSSYAEVLNVTETGELGDGTSAPVVVGTSSTPGGQPSFQISVNDETQDNPTPLTIQANRKFLVDSVTSQTNPDLQNDFINEDRRVDETTGDFANVSPNYDNTASLSGTNELQVFGGKLVYPKGDFRNTSNGGDIDYGPGNSGIEYDTLTGTRSYIGYFTDTQSVANFALEIQGSGSMVDSATSSLGTNQFIMEIRVGDESIADPSSGETGTGWLDVSEQFVTGDISDGDGAYNPDAGVNDNQTLDGTPIGVTTQTKFTANHQDRMFYKITMGNASNVEIESIEVVWGGV
jgi:hypothetical protein